jgi:protein-disulfide isomerase
VAETYIADGTVRIVWRHLVILGGESAAAAEASECAADQGAFWPYHDKLFAEQAGRNSGAFAPDRLKRYAAEIGLDAGAFAACLDAGRHADRVRAETELGRRRGVEGTPTLIVDGQRLDGPLTFERISQVVESARAS